MKTIGFYIVSLVGKVITNDKVFLLSFDELCEYYELTPVDEERDLVFGEDLIAEGTPYAIGKNLRTQTIDDETLEELKELGYSGSCKGLNGGEWFLRSPGINSLRVCGVDSYGRTDTSGKAVFDKGIRPVLWLK